ncbi:MAG TPA: FAD-binding protein, partial [Solirubrobacteraceae bacterium]|nr:FAD-binding protein [Solirubrobacteraceae bacterium]
MTTLTDGAVATLRRRLNGVLFLPGDVGFDEATRLWNRMIETPALVVQPADTADVIAAVDHARRRRFAVSVRGGGHNRGHRARRRRVD